jgi:hypothetical protein
MIDLYNNKYDRKTLKDHIYAVKMLDILKTQTIDVTFAVRYILNKNYQFDEEDEKLTPTDVLFYQPHITKNSLIIEMFKYQRDDDSVDDFETVANRN